MKNAFALAASASLLISLTGCAGVPKADKDGCDSAWNGYLKMLEYYPKAALRDGSLTASQAITYLAAMQVYAEAVTATSKTVESKELREALNVLASSVSTMQADFQAHPLNADKQIVIDFTTAQDGVDVICKGYGWKPAKVSNPAG